MQSQAHWQVAQAVAQPKPAKELAFPTHHAAKYNDRKQKCPVGNT